VNDEDVCAGTFIASGSCSDCTGACCATDDTCSVITEAACGLGTYFGNEVECGEVDCAGSSVSLPVDGVCCYDGGCDDVSVECAQRREPAEPIE
jgi:hypothetical protein